MKIIEERSKVYGDFKDIAEVSQSIKKLYSKYNNEKDKTINEAIDMIIHKLSRIICGGSKYIDNYRDIIGYSKLITNYLEEESDEALDSEVFYRKKIVGVWTELQRNINEMFEK